MEYTRVIQHPARILLVVAFAVVQGQVGFSQSVSERVLGMSDAEQASFAKSVLDAGMPAEQAGAFSELFRARRPLILPVLEQKLEEVLKSAGPIDSSTTKNVDPEAFIRYAVSAIEYEGDAEALRVAGKLLKIDEKRFDRMVFDTLAAAINRQANPFTIAYQGVDLDDRAVSIRIAGWVEAIFAKRIPEWPGGPPSLERRWAEAMVDRYGGPPVLEQWRNDPIVSRIKEEVSESLRHTIFQLAVETSHKRELIRHMLGASAAEQADWVKAVLDRGIAPPRNPRTDPPWIQTTEAAVMLSLIHNRSAVVLPVMANKWEQVFKSPNPIECFTDKFVNVGAFLDSLSLLIVEGGDQSALIAASRVLSLNPKYHLRLIEMVLYKVRESGNPFQLAYRGMELGDPVVQDGISSWAEHALALPASNVPGDVRHQWADAMVARYAGTPSAEQWKYDPIASRIKTALARSLQDEILRIAADEIARRARK